MSQLIAYAKAEDFEIVTEDAVYSKARENNSPFSITANDAATTSVGTQLIGIYQLFQSYLSFDTSAIGTDTVTGVTLELLVNDDMNFPISVTEIYKYDWTTSASTAEWVKGSEVATLYTNGDMVASVLASSIASANPGYVTCTNTAAFKSKINRTGNTKLLVTTNKFRLGNAPLSGIPLAERWQMDEGDGAATGCRLTVDYSTPSAGTSNNMFMGANF